MADLTLLHTFPAPVRVFIGAAQHAGIEYSEDRVVYDDGTRSASLHGSVEAFKSLPEMAAQRIPLNEGYWRLAIGIAGWLEREGDSLTAIIAYTTGMGPRTRCRAAERMRGDRAFGAFMQRVLRPVVVD